MTVEIPETMLARLDELTALPARRARIVDNAINAALDAEGWPTGLRGELAIKTRYWYVTVKDRATKRVIGHVGPIDSQEKAHRVAAAWRTSGRLAWADTLAAGRNLTNAEGV